MKHFTKAGAVICAIALIVSSIVYYPNNAKAVSYDSLSYNRLSDDLSYSQLSNGVEGMSPDSPLLLDGGATLQFAFAATNTNVKLSLNGENVTTSDDRVLDIQSSIVKVNPQKFPNDSYTLITISSSKGTSEYVIKKGNPAGGEIVTPAPGGGESSPEQQQTPSDQTPSVPAASSIPKKLFGMMATNVSGMDTIDNAIMLAWAGADNPDNGDGYDPTVTAVAVYIYKDGALVTKIGNATNGGIIGGLSAGTYTVKAANVNAKGEGPFSDTTTFTVTGNKLDYTYPQNCVGPKAPTGLSYITGNPEVPADNPAQKDNKLGVSWAASSTPSIPSYDSSVVGYNLYIFDAETGKPYRRVYVEGAGESNVILDSVSAGEYIVCLSAVNSKGEESALAATSFGQSSKVTVKGVKLDNGQSFDGPNQPVLPEGLEIITEGIQYGFTVSWSSAADLSGQRLNLFVDGVCIKCGINEGQPSYYENRLAAGTYTVEVKAQYIENNVESFGLSKQITVAADPGLEVKTPAELADPSYVPYQPKEPNTTESKEQGGETPGGSVTPGESVTPGGSVTPPTTSQKDKPSGTQPTKEPQSTKPPVSTTKPATTPGKVRVGKVTIRKATKKKKAKKINLKFKKVAGANKYKIQISKTKKFKKVLVKKTTKKISLNINNKKFKKAKKLYVRVKAVKVVSGKTYEGAWSKPKRIKIKK